MKPEIIKIIEALKDEDQEKFELYISKLEKNYRRHMDAIPDRDMQQPSFIFAGRVLNIFYPNRGFESQEDEPNLKIKPDKIILKDDPIDKGFFLVTLYGIEFRKQEGGTLGMKPLQEIADGLKISLENLQEVLREYHLLNSDNEISDDYCPMEPIATNKGRVIDTAPYPGFVLSNMVVYKDGKFPQTEEERKMSTKNNPNVKFEGIYGHEQFIVDLIKLSKGYI